MQMFDIAGSSSIRSYGWELAPGSIGPRRKGLLAVQFTNGETYYYAGVPERTLEDFLMADSRGKFFEQHIKGKFQFTKAEKEIT